MNFITPTSKIYGLMLGISALCATQINNALEKKCAVAPYYSVRSQSQNNPRLFVGQAKLCNLHDVKELYGNFAITTEYTRSMRPGQIAEALFGDSLYNKQMLKIKGSKLPRNEKKDLLAENFYLSDYYDSTLCLTPRIENFLVDFNFYLGLGVIGHGMYMRIHAPVTWTKWDAGIQETVINNGNFPSSAYFNTNVTNFFDYACRGKSAPEKIYNGTAHALGAAQICPCSQSKTALSDAQLDLGWNCASQEDWHAGLYLRAVAPTGTRPNGQSLFEPIIGNGKHWEIGGGLDARWTAWRSNDTESEFGVYLDASVTHLLKTRQKRAFDLKGHGPLSRYLLLSNPTGNGNNNVTPAANITLTHVNVKCSVQADVMLMFNYTRDTFNWDFGYNFWARSCEKIDCCKINSCRTCDNNQLCTGLDGKTWETTYANSTIHTEGEGESKKLGIEDLDIQGARTKGLSHKIFSTIGYTWWEHDDRVIPFLGVGIEAELGKRPSCCKTQVKNGCEQNKNCGKSSCQYCPLSQWGVWLKGGFSF